MEQLLRLIEADCTLTHKQLAAMTGTSEEKVDAEIKRLEEDGTMDSTGWPSASISMKK